MMWGGSGTLAALFDPDPTTKTIAKVEFDLSEDPERGRPASPVVASTTAMQRCADAHPGRPVG